MKTTSILAVCALCLSAVACESETPTPADASTPLDTTPADAATDVTADVAADARTDASTDAGADPWACLGMVTTMPPGGTTLNVMFTARDFQTGNAMSGVTVKVCARADLTCATPQSMGVTDAMGAVALTAVVGPSGFDGYFELTGGTGANEVVPTRTFPNPPLAAGTRPFVNNVIPRLTFELLGGLLMARLDSTTGGITGQAVDCNGRPTRGVAVSLTPTTAGTTSFYIAGGLPSTTATQTDATGLFGVVNLPAGEYTLVANRVSPMARVGAHTLNVRAGYISVSANLAPSP